MKVDLYTCDRCGDPIHVDAESNLKPITVKHIDGRFPNDEEQKVHLCGNCYPTILLALCDEKGCREAFDKLAEHYDAEGKRKVES